MFWNIIDGFLMLRPPAEVVRYKRPGFADLAKPAHFFRYFVTSESRHTQHTHTHTHTVSPVIHKVVKSRAMIRYNHDTCKRGPPLIKVVGDEHREDAVGGGWSKQLQTDTHTVSPVIHRVDGASGNDWKQS